MLRTNTGTADVQENNGAGPEGDGVREACPWVDNVLWSAN
jgi:hypothetical protein